MNVKRSIFALFLSLYLLTTGGHTYSTDEESMFYVTAALARRGGFDTPAITEASVSMPMLGVDKKWYAPYGILPSAVALPLFHVGNVAAKFFPTFYSGYILRFFITLLLNPLFTALTATLLFTFALRLGYTLRAALVTALMYGLGTMAWVYTKNFFSEPLGTLMLFAAFLLLYRYRRQPHWRLLVASGICVGLAGATKIAALIAAPVLLAYLLWVLFTRRAQMNQWAWAQALAAWALPLAALVGAVALYNYIRFANPFETGYRGGVGYLFRFPVPLGLYGLLLSPGKSLLLYAPVVLLSIPALWLFARRHRAEALACLGLVVVHLIFYARYDIWHGDSAWGPRFMVFILPFLLLPVAALVEWLAQPLRDFQPARRWWRLLVAAIFGAGIVIQLLGIAVNFDIYINLGIPAERRYFDPQWSPLVGQLQVLIAELTAPYPVPPMPEGAVARFGWFFDPALPHPLDFWFLYVIYSGMPTAQIILLVAPLLLICALGLIFSLNPCAKRAN